MRLSPALVSSPRPNLPERPGWFTQAPLTRPLWWAALALLLLNDNVLKGRGIVPGWLTGKLSDFAFLIVAPVLAAALLPAALRGRRALALAAVVGLYVAADVSQSVSDAVVNAAALLGMRWRLWPDVSDLVALAVLPLTWRLMHTTTPAQPRLARVIEPAGVMIGALVCLATSAPLEYYHEPFLVNRTTKPVELTLT
jgi:hypothetical protein